MPRATHPGPAALRNRNRVTNKTRLKVIRDTIEADSIVLDEDEEKARVVSTAGVDAEDANEHHLQAVLSAAASRHQATTRNTRSGETKESAPAAYIPTPDSTGVVQHYDVLYPPGLWNDPHSYVKSSDTVEEATSFALAGGFIYFMDERDKEWLDKNNEQARGEGMSMQGAVSSSGTRSGRSAKAKGKEPDIVQAVPINEDEFELVMAIFEKVTHEKTEFLHHGLEQGAPFPPFSDYQDTFAFSLHPNMFAVYSVPSWIPVPPQMLRYARIIYPYWRERRQERDGHRIIPAVNLDESDTKNESYICFRRREIKAVRKTRASQTSYSDRMVRLQNELAMALDIIRLVQQREILKQDSHQHASSLWDKRQTLADVKRAHPSLGTKEDDELFLDKERPPKKPRVETSSRASLKLRHPPRENGDVGSPVAQPTPVVRPKERCAAIQSAIESEMQRLKEKDKSWEDATDNPYQALPVSFNARQFKFIPPQSIRIPPAQLFTDDDENPVKYHAGRVRTARGGRRVLDRRFVNCRLRAATFDKNEVEEREFKRRVDERFRYDDDDAPPAGPRGLDEQDRKLIDECQSSRLMFTMAHTDDYLAKMTVDPTLRLSSGDVKPYHPGPPPTTMIKPPPHVQRPQPVSTVPGVNTTTSQLATTQVNGTPIAVPAQVKLAHLRISSNGNMRVHPGNGANGTQHPTSPLSTPPSSAALNNATESQVSPPRPDVDVKMASHGSPNGVPAHPEPVSAPMASPTPPSKPVASNSNVNVPNLTNGYHIPTMPGYPTAVKGTYGHPRPNGLIQQMQSLQAMLPTDSVNLALRQPGAYVMPNNAYPMQMPGGRPIQWPMTGQHSPPTVNIAVDGSSSQPPASSPGRVPSANGMRAPQLSQGRSMANQQVLAANQAMAAAQAGSHIARLTPHSPTPHMLSPNLAAAQVNVHSSPTRTPQPAIPNPSPSLQSRQLVGGSGAAGY
ncbi:hypothetical protein GSI_00557 [Ganoderma sinense ZZ0214-1]|uniref:Enhancer of polycomb-like protein n=1 Tax=Ganoderma sinense ZZ0214-1 TaxID=1077348 RepID=A0A2G8SSW7_9APHY|nr:hypothetical protein GSI_00557 [Ganoderma sinense ZZ0214-1]